MILLRLFHELQSLLGVEHCPRCQVTQAVSALCENCQQAMGFEPKCTIRLHQAFPVWEVFTWNRRVHRIWYGVKFYQRYGAFFLIQSAFRQALELIPDLENIQGTLYVVHPPIRAGRPNLFAPIWVALCREKQWIYVPNAFEFTDPKNTLPLHRSTSIPERQRLMQDRFQLHPHFKARFHAALLTSSEAPSLLVVDDFMTTGTTLSACFTLLQHLVNAAKTPKIPTEKTHQPTTSLCDKIESINPSPFLGALVMTTVPKEAP